MKEMNEKHQVYTPMKETIKPQFRSETRELAPMVSKPLEGNQQRRNEDYFLNFSCNFFYFN